MNPFALEDWQLALLDENLPTALAAKRECAGAVVFDSAESVYHHYYTLYGDQKLADALRYQWQERKQMEGR